MELPVAGGVTTTTGGVTGIGGATVPPCFSQAIEHKIAKQTIINVMLILISVRIC